MKKSREEMLKELKSIREPFIADITFIGFGDMQYRVLTCICGFIWGYEDNPVQGPLTITQEQYDEVEKLLKLGYNEDNWHKYVYDDSITDEEKEHTEDVIDNSKHYFLMV